MREQLPTRRSAETITIDHRGLAFSISVGRFEDERPAELFVDGLKSGADVRESVRDAAVLASLALQYGCPLETISHALARDVAGRSAWWAQ
jgi:ribonucleoside-diphosphate reductase alpha chain